MNSRFAGRNWYRLAFALAASYTLYVIAGKVAQKLGVALPFKLGDVGEFLLVLAAMAAFVNGILCATPLAKSD